MAKRYYSKLIRDNVPAMMDAKGVVYEVRILDEAEYLPALLKKVGEEAAELASANGRDEVVAEMGDLLDVLDAIAAEYDVSPQELAVMRVIQGNKKGGFARRQFLLWSEDK